MSGFKLAFNYLRYVEDINKKSTALFNKIVIRDLIFGVGSYEKFMTQLFMVCSTGKK